MENKTHKKVQVIVIGGERLNKLLLLQTKKDRNELWQNVTGSVDEGENFASAAKRELKEETGLDADLIELNLKFEFTDRWNRNVLEKVYLARLSGEPNIIISEEEHQDYKWININEVNSDHFFYESNYESFLESLKQLDT